MTDLDAALAWADLTMNDRLREARRTGTDGDYEDKIEWCIDTLAAAVREREAALAELRGRNERMASAIATALRSDCTMGAADIDVLLSALEADNAQL
jgi:hypothetical protein